MNMQEEYVSARMHEARIEGWDMGVDWALRQIDKALDDVAMSHDERRGACILKRWIVRQQEERK